MSTTSAARRQPHDSGGVPWLRVAFGLLLVWWTVRLATGWADRCFLDLVNLAFHEAGHVFATPFGTTIHFLGGTLGQLAVPAILVGYFVVRTRQPLGAAFAAWWLGESLVDVAGYMADARDLQLQLVGGGVHDWNELFYRFDMLDEPTVRAVSGFTHGLGVVVMLVGLAWWVLLALPPAARARLRERLPHERLRILLGD